MTDTRRHILQTIRGQEKLLHQADVLKQQPYVHVWSAQQWWESFQFLFINHSPAADSAHHDDLLFFVKSPSHPAIKESPYFVRRKAAQLPEELQLSGSDFSNVNWPRTVLLNIVLQSQYQLTVVACGREALPFVAEGRTWTSDMITVSKPVYASTTITAVNLDSSRAEASNPQPCYPDICFAVDNFDNAFEDLVLEDAGKCYCVVLHAVLDTYDDAAAEPLHADIITAQQHHDSSRGLDSSGSMNVQQQEQEQEQLPGRSLGSSSSSTHVGAAAAAACASSRGASSDGGPGSPPWQIGTRRRTLFAGYVSYGQIADFLENSARSKTLLDAWMGGKAAQQDKVVMTGPGGVGHCEVAVKKLDHNSRSSSATPGSSQHSGAAAAAALDQAAANSSTDGSSSRQAVSSSGDGSTVAGPQVRPPPPPPPQQQQQLSLLQRGLHRARMLASGMQQAVSDINSGTACNMNCAMMLLKLPVSHVARQLLDAV